MTNAPHKPRLTHHALRQFTGDDVRYRHPISRNVIYTPGVQYLAEQGQAYWLIDAIASYFNSPQMDKAMQADDRLRWMQFWRLRVQENHAALLTAEADAGETPFVTQQIEFTDFPLAEINIWAAFDGANWTLYLPSEH